MMALHFAFRPHLAAAYPGIDGFLPGSRATIMLDVVFVAMFAVVLALAVSIWLVKFRRRYDLHKRIQLTLGVVLVVAIAAFEVDMQFVSGWRARATPVGMDDVPETVLRALYIHLCFAVPTAVLWVIVIARALRNFPRPAAPAPHSRSHVAWGKAAAVGIVGTAVTGWIFYWLAFVA
jgi:hypothetical protein